MDQINTNIGTGFFSSFFQLTVSARKNTSTVMTLDLENLTDVGKKKIVLLLDSKAPLPFRNPKKHGRHKKNCKCFIDPVDLSHYNIYGIEGAY